MNVLGMDPDKITGDDLLKPDNPEFHFISGIECMKKGAYAEAEECFRQTLRLVSSRAAGLRGIGRVPSRQRLGGLFSEPASTTRAK